MTSGGPFYTKLLCDCIIEIHIFNFLALQKLNSLLKFQTNVYFCGIQKKTLIMLKNIANDLAN